MKCCIVLNSKHLDILQILSATPSQKGTNIVKCSIRIIILPFWLFFLVKGLRNCWFLNLSLIAHEALSHSEGLHVPLISSQYSWIQLAHDVLTMSNPVHKPLVLEEEYNSQYCSWLVAWRKNSVRKQFNTTVQQLQTATEKAIGRGSVSYPWNHYFCGKNQTQTAFGMVLIFKPFCWIAFNTPPGQWAH